MDLQKFYSGDVYDAYNYFGAHFIVENGIEGVLFRVFAPNADRILLIGDFNNWDGQGSEMRKGKEWGMYSLFIPRVKEGMMYKYRIIQSNGIAVDKSDPYGFSTELRPGSASVVTNIDDFKFDDEKWMKNRDLNYEKPVNIYEIHFGSWRHKSGSEDRLYSYTELCSKLIDYIKKNEFTHIEIMPICEYPFDGSWGYQATGYFSVTSRYGTPKEFMYFVNECHKNNIGIILDFVPVHFAIDEFALAKFDGTELYEYNNDAVSHSEWGSCNFNFSRGEVQTFLLSAANFWIDKYHIDGLRMDAIGNVIYWQGNEDRGVNDVAVNFIRKINSTISKLHQGVMLIAEDSTSFKKVTAPTEYGGLGFTYKWDMGWMNDTLKFFSLPPKERKENFNLLTFSMFYFYNENYMLPLSHDEVVHGKKSIIDKMYGEYEEKFAQVKTLYAYMFIHPGKKLNFMGNELAHFREWDEKKELDWHILDYPNHLNFQKYFKKLNHIYKNYDELNQNEYNSEFYKRLNVKYEDSLIYAFERKSKDKSIILILNLDNKKHEKLILEYDKDSTFNEIVNSDSTEYGGGGILNEGAIKTKKGSAEEGNFIFNIKIEAYSSVILESVK